MPIRSVMLDIVNTSHVGTNQGQLSKNIGPGGGGPPPFDPGTIAGLVYNEDVSSFPSMTIGAGNKVSRINDLSPSGNFATQLTSANQGVYDPTAGIYAKPGIVQSNGTEFMTLNAAIPVSTNGTYYFVVLQSTTGGVQSVTGNNATGETLPNLTGGNKFEMYDSNASADFTGSPTTATPVIWACYLNGGRVAAQFAVNGTLLPTAGTSGPAAWAFNINLIGARTNTQWNFPGTRFQICAFNSNLAYGGADDLYMTSGLTTKWLT